MFLVSTKRLVFLCQRVMQTCCLINNGGTGMVSGVFNIAYKGSCAESCRFERLPFVRVNSANEVRPLRFHLHLLSFAIAFCSRQTDGNHSPRTFSSCRRTNEAIKFLRLRQN